MKSLKDKHPIVFYSDSLYFNEPAFQTNIGTFSDMYKQSCGTSIFIIRIILDYPGYTITLYLLLSIVYMLIDAQFLFIWH